MTTTPGEGRGETSNAGILRYSELGRAGEGVEDRAKRIGAKEHDGNIPRGPSPADRGEGVEDAEVVREALRWAAPEPWKPLAERTSPALAALTRLQERAEKAEAAADGFEKGYGRVLACAEAAEAERDDLRASLTELSSLHAIEKAKRGAAEAKVTALEAALRELPSGIDFNPTLANDGGDVDRLNEFIGNIGGILRERIAAALDRQEP